ncbi:MAG: tryptophan synthase subunit alpha [Chloroflexi bacterium]|nr:MAG: tryptophan synthase subunit alpha [Chloroflexota bacterium]
MTATHAAPRLTNTRLTRTFEQLRAQRRAALLPFVTAGWPELADTERLVPALIEGGGDIIEIGVPFSDPIADGLTIQRTNQRALENGVTPRMALEMVARMRANGVVAPILFMGYYNPVFQYGLDAYAAKCAEVGVDGLIIPDLPPEESDALLEACVSHGIHLIYLLAPTSTPERVQAVIERANGFIYLVAVTGVTGARGELAEGLADYVARVRRHTSIPLAIGFGISTREHVARVEKLVDGVIVASALLNHLEHVKPDDLPAEAKGFVQALRGD